MRQVYGDEGLFGSQPRLAMPLYSSPQEIRLLFGLRVKCSEPHESRLRVIFRHNCGVNLLRLNCGGATLGSGVLWRKTENPLRFMLRPHNFALDHTKHTHLCMHPTQMSRAACPLALGMHSSATGLKSDV